MNSTFTRETHFNMWRNFAYIHIYIKNSIVHERREIKNYIYMYRDNSKRETRTFIYLAIICV